MRQVVSLQHAKVAHAAARNFIQQRHGSWFGQRQKINSRAGTCCFPVFVCSWCFSLSTNLHPCQGSLRAFTTLMGIFKKFFSIGSKKSKKRFAANHAAQPPALPSPKHLRVLQDDEAEEAVSRLLRSSSARFAAEPEADFSSLPPLRELSHPRDRLANVTVRQRILSTMSSLPQLVRLPAFRSGAPTRSLCMGELSTVAQNSLMHTHQWTRYSLPSGRSRTQSAVVPRACQ